MNSKRISFGFLVLAVYAVLGVVGLYSQPPSSTTEICATDIVNIATSADASGSSAGGGGSASANVEWHSFLPGAFK
jgi:hypothetical protein